MRLWLGFFVALSLLVPVWQGHAAVGMHHDMMAVEAPCAEAAAHDHGGAAHARAGSDAHTHRGDCDGSGPPECCPAALCASTYLASDAAVAALLRDGVARLRWRAPEAPLFGRDHVAEPPPPRA